MSEIWLSEKQVMARYGVSRRTLARWRDREYVTYRRLPNGRISYPLSGLDDFDRRTIRLATA